MVFLDLKYKKILHELDLNSRQSDAQIAKKVGLSRESVRYRINKLIKEEYIHYFMTVLNTMKLGFMWYRTFFKFQGLSFSQEIEMLSWLKNRVSWMTKIEGKWDLNTGFFCKTVYEYRDFINEFLELYSDFIDDYDVATVTRMWHYNRDYFLGKKMKSLTYSIMGYSPNEKYLTEKIDKIDYKILQTLLKDARANIVDIARKINSTEMVVKYRIKKMIKKKIILGFRPFFNLNKLGYLYFKVHFKLKNYSKEKKNKLLEYVHLHLNTIHTTELVGGENIETEFQVKNNEELYMYIRKIRDEFTDIIKDYEFMQYTKEEKFTYLPEIKF